jgi:tetratricopeptide (TPR) repeat protein
MPHVLHEPAHRFLLADILEGSAATARGPDQRAEAEKQYGEVLKIRKELVAIDPDNLNWRAAYIFALAHAGQFEDAAQRAEALEMQATKSPALMLQAARC